MGTLISLTERRAASRLVADDSLVFADRLIADAERSAIRDLTAGVHSVSTFAKLRLARAEIAEARLFVREESRGLRGPEDAA